MGWLVWLLVLASCAVSGWALLGARGRRSREGWAAAGFAGYGAAIAIGAALGGFDF